MNQNSISKKHVEEKTFTISAATQDFTIDQNFPIGLVRRLWLYVSGAITAGGGTQTTEGAKTILRSVTVESTLHGILYHNVDGLGLHRLMTILFGKAPVTAISATAHSCLFHIPFGFLGLLRHPSKRLNDMALWAQRAKLKVNGTIGVLTDLVTGGSPSVTTKARLVAEYQPNPDPRPWNEDPKLSGDAPGLQIEVMKTQNSALSTSGTVDTYLPIGQNRNLIAVMVREYDSANLAEVSDIFTAGTSTLEVRHGSDVIVDRVRVTDLDAIVGDLSGLAVPAGCHMVYLPQDGRLTDARALDAVQELKFSFDNLATATDRVLQFYCIYGKPVKDGAEPAAQA